MLAGCGRRGDFAVRQLSHCLAVFMVAGIASCGANQKLENNQGTFALLTHEVLPDRYVSVHATRVNGQYCSTGDKPNDKMLEKAFADALSKADGADALMLVKIRFARSNCIDVEGTPVNMIK